MAGSLPGAVTIRNMAPILGKNSDALLTMVDKVAVDVLTISIKGPVMAHFLPAHLYLTKIPLDASVGNPNPSDRAPCIEGEGQCRNCQEPLSKVAQRVPLSTADVRPRCAGAAPAVVHHKRR